MLVHKTVAVFWKKWSGLRSVAVLHLSVFKTTACSVIKRDYLRVHNYPVTISFPRWWHQLLKYYLSEIKENIRIMGKCDWMAVSGKSLYSYLQFHFLKWVNVSLSSCYCQRNRKRKSIIKVYGICFGLNVMLHHDIFFCIYWTVH